MRCMAGLVLAVFVADVAAGPDLDELRASVVQVFTVGQAEDYSRPWMRPRPQQWSGSAFFVGDGRLLTNAHNVADSKIVRVKRADRTKRYEARVLFAGHDCDLAVITVEDPAFFTGMKPLAIGDRPELHTKVSTVGYPTGGNKLSVTEGIVSRIEFNNYSHSRGDAHLTIQTDAAINPGNSGGPVLQAGRVVGVAFQGQLFSQSIGYMIPPSVIRHFIADTKDGTYHGYPELGLYTGNLQNEGLRRYLGVPADETGVVILKPTPYASCAGLVQRNDVLHKIDGIAIENDGTIRVGSDFFDFAFVVEGKQIGETVRLTIRRNGKVIEVPVTLRAWGARMRMSQEYDRQPEYCVVGGFVFVPLTFNYLLRSRGSEELSYYMQQYYRTVAEPGKTREQLVLLARVLPHETTKYREYNNSIVKSVDGVVPNDFAHFLKLLDTAQKNLVRIEFEGVNPAPLVLDRKRLAAVQEAILQQFRIKNARHVRADSSAGSSGGGK